MSTPTPDVSLREVWTETLSSLAQRIAKAPSQFPTWAIRDVITRLLAEREQDDASWRMPTATPQPEESTRE